MLGWFFAPPTPYPLLVSFQVHSHLSLLRFPLCFLASPHLVFLLVSCKSTVIFLFFVSSSLFPRKSTSRLPSSFLQVHSHLSLLRFPLFVSSQVHISSSFLFPPNPQSSFSSSFPPLCFLASPHIVFLLVSSKSTVIFLFFVSSSLFPRKSTYRPPPSFLQVHSHLSLLRFLLFVSSQVHISSSS